MSSPRYVAGLPLRDELDDDARLLSVPPRSAERLGNGDEGQAAGSRFQDHVSPRTW